MSPPNDADASSNDINAPKGPRRSGRGRGRGGRGGRGHATKGRSQSHKSGTVTEREGDKEGNADSSKNHREGEGRRSRGGERGRGGRGERGGRGSGRAHGSSGRGRGKGRGSSDEKQPNQNESSNAAQSSQRQNKGEKKQEAKKSKPKEEEKDESDAAEHTIPKNEKRNNRGGKNSRKKSTKNSREDEPQPPAENSDAPNSAKPKSQQNEKRNNRRKNSRKNSKQNGQNKDPPPEKISEAATSDTVPAAPWEQPTLEDLEQISAQADKKKRRNKSRTKKTSYPEYIPLATCLSRYASKDVSLVRGTIRVLPKKDGMAFVSCDRGSLDQDVRIGDKMAINRAMDGDRVFVEILPMENEGGGEEGVATEVANTATLADYMEGLDLDNDDEASGANTMEVDDQNGVIEGEENEIDTEKDEEDVHLSADDFEDYDIEEDVDDPRNEAETWQDDHVQMSLWNPAVKVRKAPSAPPVIGTDGNGRISQLQRSGRVVCVIPPAGGKKPASELRPGDGSSETSGNKIIDSKARRTIVGTVAKLPGDRNSRYLLTPNNKSLPQFVCPSGWMEKSSRQNGGGEGSSSTTENGDRADETSVIYRAEYRHGSWKSNMKWPPCMNLEPVGGSCDVEGETAALLAEFGVDHGEFEPDVLRDVEEAVRSGREKAAKGEEVNDLGWRPTPEMYKGRRDYRSERIFTIDPTTAKDLDDALHIKQLPDGRVEIGVHIADVSHFVTPDTAVDSEAMRRATTVYLVDRTVPMLPRPLCEIACSLNENVERLAFSCVWKMNMDGTMKGKGQKSNNRKKGDEVWYGRTVIKSCARLDYATAQNIIEGKVATGEKVEDVDVTLWPQSRQPTGGHTIDEVAGDVRLMNRVAQARRALRFQNGALALNGVKLAFQLGADGEAPELCEPYPIRDSNRLVEEYMLLANYLVAERLISHAGDRAVLRNHPPPLEKGIESVVDVARESVGFHIDASTSQSLQESLSRLGRECDDELVMQCVTELAMVPMRPAEYLAAGTVEEEQWRHFALNIPYYTHFTSPIRRYPDVMVHRLLQATIDGTVDDNDSNRDMSEIQQISEHCNEKRMSSKQAQDRSDRVFLSLFLKAKPIRNVLGVVLSIGEKTFTIFVPSLGLNTRVFIDEHNDRFDIHLHGEPENRQIVMQPKEGPVVGQGNDHKKSQIRVKIFAKLKVSCYCKEKAPIDVKVLVEGNWDKR